ncbi:MAG: hypothetical protein AB1768_17675 [Pseudomonadota bacterium]
MKATRAISLLAALLAAGCATPPPAATQTAPEKTEAAKEADEVVSLLALLEGVGGRLPAGESPRRQLATLLARLTADQARETKRLEAQVKEEQRRADELQQKLDAMLKIEENLRRGRR